MIHANDYGHLPEISLHITQESIEIPQLVTSPMPYCLSNDDVENIHLDENGFVPSWLVPYTMSNLIITFLGLSTMSIYHKWIISHT